MKSKVWVAALCFSLAAFCSQVNWQLALPGYHFQFPLDYLNHPDYQTEWWYYTGNLKDAKGHKFGFELTFFRFALNVTQGSGVWRPDELYLAHLALSDIDGREFYHTERLNRGGPGIAGVDNKAARYWNGNWSVHWEPGMAGNQQLQAITDRLQLNLRLAPAKPIVIHGEDGVDQKGPQPGQASHYISFTRLNAKGQLQWMGKTFSLTGLAWMDHEYFTQQLDKTLTGWDWFAIQLDNNQELMLYRLRRGAGDVDPFSSGTFVDSNGKGHHLTAAQFSLTPGDQWKGAASGGTYPMNWRIDVPSLGLRLTEHTALENQELFSPKSLSPTYWEGAVTFAGSMHEAPVHGVGYLEMTGYAPGGLKNFTTK